MLTILAMTLKSVRNSHEHDCKEMGRRPMQATQKRPQTSNRHKKMLNLTIEI